MKVWRHVRGVLDSFNLCGQTGLLAFDEYFPAMAPKYMVKKWRTTLHITPHLELHKHLGLIADALLSNVMGQVFGPFR
jgi:hypothetical protein